MYTFFVCELIFITKLHQTRWVDNKGRYLLKRQNSSTLLFFKYNNYMLKKDFGLLFEVTQLGWLELYAIKP